MLVQWNDTATPLPDKCVHQLFEAQVEESPDATAVLFQDERLTYGELNARANQLAHALIGLGVVPDAPVAIALERSLEMIVALLAVLKAGGAYVPLDLEYPTTRLVFMLEDSGARILITQESLSHRLPRIVERILCYDTDAAAIARQPESNPNQPVAPENLAYIIYTSGSTGKPKGVAIEHRGPTALLQWARTVWTVDELRCVLSGTSICFDLSVYELFLPLSVGGAVILVENVLELLTIKCRDMVTLINTVPSAMNTLLVQGGIPAGVRVVNLAGEPLTMNLADRIYGVPTIRKVYDLYGPSEDTVYTTFKMRSPGEAPSIGRPIANTRIYILDGHLQPTPIGVPGELHIGGAGLARGYLNRPELTAEKFIPDPFSDVPGARLYKTGDLARYRPDGNIEFLGRMDHQVKIRGFRIELGEIDAALAAHPGVREALVIAGSDADGEKCLVAYVVSVAEQPAPGELRTFLQRSLPDYMLPAAWVFLPALPLTPNGKVDRKALPEPDACTSSGAAPRDPLEEVLVCLWATLLHKPGIGIHDNFFEHGGHSLLAIRLTSRLRDELEMDIPVRRLFEAPTVAEFARQIRTLQQGDAHGQEEAAARLIPPAPRDRELPLSFAQQRLWFLHQLEGPSSTYNIPLVLELAGPLDLEALNRAFSEIIRRHEVLRSRLLLRGDEPIQLVSPAGVVTLPVVDLRESTDPEMEAHELARREAADPFDLARDEPLRLRLLRRGESAWTLLLTLQHVAADGWSLAILFRELAILYGAFREGKPSPLPELGIQYADYAVWQRGWLTGERRNRQLHYWQSHLAGAPDCLNLSTDRPRPSRQSHRGGVISFTVDSALTSDLHELGRRSGATLFMTLLAAWATLLSRYSGEDDLIIGSPVANRTQSAVEPLIGFFVNTLALRADLSGNPSFLELMARIRHTCLEAYAHQELPLEILVESLGVTRNLAHGPLFQVMFVLQNADEEAPLLDGLDITLAKSESTTAKFDLTLSITEGDGALAATLEYATDLFNEETIERLGGQFRKLLRSLLANPEQLVSLLDILPPQERKRLLVDWNDTAAPLPEKCVHQLFEAQVEESPDAVAVLYQDESLTYAELNVRANQLAHALIERGVGPDAPVAIALERSSEMIVALLAILKSGGTYVPLDPEYPTKRLAFMLEDSGARILITRESLFLRLPRSVEHTLCLDSEAAAIARQPESNPNQPVAPENLAYIIYTSGSTGKPKGCLIQHRSVVRLVKNTNYVVITPSDLFLQFAPISFDAATFEIWGALLNGAGLVVFSPRIPTPEELGAFIGSRGITILWLTASLFHLMVDHELQSLTGVRQILAGGDFLSAPHVRKFLEILPPGHRFINGYGPTESTTFACCHLMNGSSVIEGQVPIGKPISNTTLFILDGSLRPVPLGVPGELHIGGAGLARGYLNRPELTAEKFIPDPFSDAPGARLYKTGDLVRYRPDGNIEFLGRMDHQVKIRGFRIELGEIEAALAAHPGVREVLVITGSDADGEKRLVAYVVPVADRPAPGELRTFLKMTLPDYMLPAAFVFLKALPLTPNGKIDRKALPEPDACTSASTGTAPRNPLEEVLVGLWATLLHQPGIGIHDNFFELGGHSLLATRLTSRLRDALEMDIPVRRLFEFPTVAGLADWIHIIQQGDAHGQEEAAARLISPAPRDREPPLSFAQQRLWFLHQLEGPSSTYNIPLVLELAGPLDLEALNRAFSEIIRRHEVLRSRLLLRGDEPIQLVSPAGVVTLPVVDLRESTDPEMEAHELARREAADPFDLARDEPLRLRLLRRGESAWTLLLTLQHVAADGWSLAILFRELAILYGAFREGKPSPLPELGIQYADYAVWQRGWLTGERRNRQLHYWQSHLAGAPDCLNLPTDRSRPPRQSHQGGTVAFAVDALLTAELHDLGRRSGATLFMTLLAAWAILLSRYSGEEDLVIGSPVANRTQSAVEPLIGFFVNTLALRADLSGNPPFLELLARLRHTCLDAYAHQELPFEILVESLGVTRNLAHAPLFQIMFILQNADPAAPLLPGLDVTLAESEGVTAKFDLTLSVTELHGGLTATLEYALDLFDEETIQRLGGQFQELLRSVVANPEQQVSLLAILPSEERRRLLVDWNNTAAPLPEKCVHQLFEAQVEESPDAVAVLFQDERLTYRELNARANQLAHTLIRLGVVPDAPVAIALERSPEMIVALLAVLKAGGAYVPLDPGYPSTRLSFMLEDSGARILITQETVRHRLTQKVEHTLSLDTQWTDIACQSEMNPHQMVAPEHLAYIIYTSGSTGKPKGVAVGHGGLFNFLQTMQRNPGFNRKDSLLAVTTVSFDIFGLEIYLPLICGGRIVVTRSFDAVDPVALITLLDKYDITVFQATPATWLMLIDAGWSGKSNLKMLVGGEALSGFLARKMLFRGASLWNLYGPTETTIWSSCYLVTEQDTDHAVVTIGRPVANTQLYILDSHLESTPMGVPGELHIGGAGLARGYLNRPELTAEKFISDPFSDVPGARLYKSGDLARYRSDGNIEFLGRMDHQVKIRGFRIELGEIEAALAAHPGVREALVSAGSDADGEKRLVAYVVPAADRPAPGELRAFLKVTLPDYMLPAAFVFPEALPLTPNGKIDRKGLPEPEAFTDSDNSAGDLHATPRNLLEQQLLQLWHKALGQSDFGIHANFFSMGGHSLIAARLASEIDHLVGHKVPIASFFHAQTVATLAVLLRNDEETPAWSSLVPLQPKGEKTPLFVLHGWGGDAYWSVHMAQNLAPERPVYGFQAVGLDGKTPRHTSIDAMAEHYAAQIRSLQPTGPYHLVGCSVGGWLAYAVADHLLRQGGAIGLLTLLDTHANANIHKWLNFNEWLELGSYLMGRVSYHVDKLRHRPEGGRITYLKKRLVSQLFYAKILLRKPKKSPEIETINNARFAHQDSPHVMDHTSTIVTFYRPPRLDLELNLVTTTKTKSRMFLFWYYYARRGVKVHRLFDNHHDYYRSHGAEPLAAFLRQLLHENENPGTGE